jgi:hypothetical protein
MRHAQLNGILVKKIDFFDKKIGFFYRKISFWRENRFFLRENSFSTYTTSVHAQISLPNFSNRKTGIPLSPFEDVPSTVFIWGSPYGNGTHFFLIPVWKRGFPISIWGCVNPCFHIMGIPVWKCFWWPKFLGMQWRLVRHSMDGQNYSPRFHRYGESPYGNAQAN